MPRSRVLSFMSQWGGNNHQQKEKEQQRQLSPSSDPAKSQLLANEKSTLTRPLSINISSNNSSAARTPEASSTPTMEQYPRQQPVPQSPSTPTSRSRADSRSHHRRISGMSQISAMQPQVEVTADTPPELAPIFSYLNSHSNKLYQEGYFLKLHDLDSRGRPSNARVWNECFAQLVGTVLSLWDAAALDAAGDEGEVMPTFINLSDASLKMIESLPMNGVQGGNLQNVLSISTAANNRYLLHFNSLNSLTQWTAGIRLAMFEHSLLQESYTGALIAGKGKYLNNIKQIMDRSRFLQEDWARVRFGAGTPWRRCWCVITPPDEKEYAKAQKIAKKNPYERTRFPKGEIRFYDTKKVTKKTRPIATITDAYAAYAIYPQSKPLVDQSTLVKLEGLITQHTKPERTTEGFVFVMPEVHPAVTGFEMMLRWLFPVYDTFALYGRPTRLIADVRDQRGLMFAMPRERRYGYLDILDVSGLIHTKGSNAWSERQWRKEMKKLTATRMSALNEDSPRQSQQLSQRRATTTSGSRISLPPTARQSLRFEEDAISQSSPGSRSASPLPAGRDTPLAAIKRTDSAPPSTFAAPHKRSASDVHGYRNQYTGPSRLSQETRRQDEYDEAAPAPPPHGTTVMRAATGGLLEHSASDDKLPMVDAYEQQVNTEQLPPPEPVIAPPQFAHSPSSRPAGQLNTAPDLRRAHSNVDSATLQEMREARQTAQNSSAIDDSSSPYQAPAQQSQEIFLPYRSYDAGEQAQSYTTKPSPHMNGNNGYARGEQRSTRLSTIPGSPYVSDQNAEYFPQRAEQHQQLMPALSESTADSHVSTPSSLSGRPPLMSNRSSQSIARKPVPRSLENPQVCTNTSIQSSTGSSPVGSFVGAIIDQDELERILNQENVGGSRSETLRSDVTPDYASTISATPSEVAKERQKLNVEKPRAGKMKVVGDPGLATASGGMHGGDTGRREFSYELTPEKPTDEPVSNAQPAYQFTKEELALPVIDFGKTYELRPEDRPGTSGTLTPGDKHKRAKSRDGLRSSSRDRLSGYFDTRPRASPAVTPEPTHRHSIAWAPPASPGPNIALHNRSQSLTPEQWVQHRAAIASQPQIPPPQLPRKPLTQHSRQNSANSLIRPKSRGDMTKTPPPTTPLGSGDWSHLIDGNRPTSRPTSRGLGAVLGVGERAHGNSPSRTTPPARLSARELTHVARATNTPLLGYAANPGNALPSPGLLGTITAREQERAAFSDGLRSASVQQAISSRQQQQQHAQFDAGTMDMQRMQFLQQQKMQQQAASLAWQNAQFAQSPQRMSYHEQLFSAEQMRLQALHPTSPSMSNYTTMPQSQAYLPPSPSIAGAGGFGGMYVQQQQRAQHRASGSFSGSVAGGLQMPFQSGQPQQSPVQQFPTQQQYQNQQGQRFR